MTPSELRRKKSCDGKDRLTMMAARSRARVLSLQLKEGFSYYKCEFCGFWHIGHK